MTKRDGAPRRSSAAMRRATTLHLVRHASYGLLDRVLAGRSPGHHLDDAGRAEAFRLGEALAAVSLAAVLSSPLERAQETAAAIAVRHDLSVAVEPGLNEIDFGEWTGLDFAALHASPAWRAFNGFRGTAPTPGGETMHQVQARMLATVLRLEAAYRGAQIALVSHGDPIKSVLAHFLGAPLDLLRRIEIAPASRSIVALYEDDAKVLAINLLPG